MEWLSVLLNLLLGSGLVGVLLFYGSRRRKERAEAAKVEISSRGDELDLHRQSVNFLSDQLHEAWGEVEKLQTIVNAKRDEILNLIRTTKQLEIELIEQIALRRRIQRSACAKQECPERINEHTL